MWTHSNCKKNNENIQKLPLARDPQYNRKAINIKNDYKQKSTIILKLKSYYFIPNSKISQKQQHPQKKNIQAIKSKVSSTKGIMNLQSFIGNIEQLSNMSPQAIFQLDFKLTQFFHTAIQMVEQHPKSAEIKATHSLSILYLNQRYKYLKLEKQKSLQHQNDKFKKQKDQIKAENNQLKSDLLVAHDKNAVLQSRCYEQATGLAKANLEITELRGRQQDTTQGWIDKFTCRQSIVNLVYMVMAYWISGFLYLRVWSQKELLLQCDGNGNLCNKKIIINQESDKWKGYMLSTLFQTLAVVGLCLIMRLLIRPNFVK